MPRVEGLKYRRCNACTCNITDEMDNGLAFLNVSVELVQRRNARSNKVLLNGHSNIGTPKFCAQRMAFQLVPKGDPPALPGWQ